MAGNAELLTRDRPDIDIAVFLAEASAAAYADGDARRFVETRGLSGYAPIDKGNVQGFYGSTPEAALLVFRGTSNIGQWIRDARVLPAPFGDWGWAHLGFVKGIEAVEDALLAFAGIARTKAHVWVAGHSLGGALAVLAAARLVDLGVGRPLILTYGQPAVGFGDFVGAFDRKLPTSLWHIINQSDIVPRVPPFPYRHCDLGKHITEPGVLEAPQGLEAAPGGLPTPRDYSQAETLRQIIIGGRAPQGLEAAPAPLSLETGAAAQLDAAEFGRLQVALGAGEPAGLEGLTLEGALPFFGDHAISEYIRLLTEIRDAPRG